ENSIIAGLQQRPRRMSTSRSLPPASRRGLRHSPFRLFSKGSHRQLWGNAMRLHFRTTVAVLLCLCATACAEQQTAALGRPNAIIVGEFALNQAAIMLDPTFGFSRYRGTPGVPPRQRAASVGRAVAFNVGDAIVEQLRRAGYDAVLSD